jgi:hypothetical protein
MNSPVPVYRRLRVLALPWKKSLQPSPVGEYIEVVDYDPINLKEQSLALPLLSR